MQVYIYRAVVCVCRCISIELSCVCRELQAWVSVSLEEQITLTLETIRPSSSPRSSLEELLLWTEGSGKILTKHGRICVTYIYKIYKKIYKHYIYTYTYTVHVRIEYIQYTVYMFTF